MRPRSLALGKLARQKLSACITLNAINKISHDFSKGVFCSCKGSGLGFFFYPCAEERKAVYEENDDVGDMIGRLLRPFLRLC